MRFDVGAQKGKGSEAKRSDGVRWGELFDATIQGTYGARGS